MDARITYRTLRITMVALAVMLGADVGTSVMAVVFSLDLSWLSPLFIFVGVVLFISRKDTAVGRVGRVLIGLGLMLLALRLITESTTVLTQSPTVRTLLGALTSDLLLEIFTGAVLAVLAYSSLATVLLTATLAGSGGIPVDVALGLVVGANLGSGILGVLTTLRSAPLARQVPLGNLIFKGLGAAIAIPLLPQRDHRCPGFRHPISAHRSASRVLAAVESANRSVRSHRHQLHTPGALTTAPVGQVVFENTAPVRSASVRSAPVRSAPVRSMSTITAPTAFAWKKLASSADAPERSAVLRSVYSRFAPLSPAPDRSAPLRSAW